MERITSKGMNALATLLGLALLAMVGLSVWNVVARYVFNAALLWADEVAVFAMIVVTWIGAIGVSWRRTEIAMNMIVTMMPASWQKPIGAIQQAITAGVCTWVAWLSWAYVEKVFRFGMTSDAARLPVWIFHGTITLSLVCMALIALWRLGAILIAPSATAIIAEESLT